MYYMRRRWNLQRRSWREKCRMSSRSTQLLHFFDYQRWQNCGYQRMLGWGSSTSYRNEGVYPHFWSRKCKLFYQKKSFKKNIKLLQIEGEYCFCDYDECNKYRCNAEFCSCGFSDPMHCKNITEGIKVLVLVKNYYLQCFIAIKDPTSNVELVLVQVAKMGRMLNWKNVNMVKAVVYTVESKPRIVMKWKSWDNVEMYSMEQSWKAVLTSKDLLVPIFKYT